MSKFLLDYTQTFEYDSIGNLIKKTSKGTDLDLKFNQDPLNYTQDYIYDSDYTHRLKSINNQTSFLYDKNGNIIEMSDESYEPKYDAQFRTFLNSQGATIYTFKYDPVTGDAPLVPRKPDRVSRRNFNERNMMIESSGIMEDTVNYYYDEDNNRTHKDNTNDDKCSLIFNDYYSIYFAHRNRTGEHYNNIMLGSTRLAIEIFNKENAMNPQRTYFFHSDHLGSNTLITDTNGDIYQYTEYTPYGEVWAEVTQNKTKANNQTQEYTNKKWNGRIFMMQENKMKKAVVVLLLIFLLSRCMNKGADDMNYIKNIDNGFVPDEKTAERIADIVLTKVYGDKILYSKPYEIVLKNEIWYINGVLKPSDFGMCPYSYDLGHF